jgi:hypothetical protein
MKKVLISFFSLALFLSLSILGVSAEAVTKTTMVGADCFDYYKFQSVQVNVSIDGESYSPGQNVIFGGKVINGNPYPVVDGNIFVRIGKKSPKYETLWNDPAAEFVAVENISVDSNSEKLVSFSWKIPAGLGAGDYQVDYFFSAGKKFNLGGLPFTNEVIVGFSNLRIDSTNKTIFQFDREKTQVNNQQYEHIGSWPDVKPGSEVIITQPINNFSDKDISVKVSYNLYFWDSLLPADKLDSKVENIVIPAKSSKIVSYKINKVDQTAYYLNIKAEGENSSSVVSIRLTSSEILKGRINYPALTVFPIQKGEDTNIFSCIHSVSGPINGAKLKISLLNIKNELIWQGDYSGDITSLMSGAVGNYIAKDDLTYLKMKTDLFDAKGNLQDTYENIYDCSTLNSEKCVQMNTIDFGPIIIVLGALIIVLLFAIAITSKSINIARKKILLSILFILLIIVSVSLIWILYGNIKKTEATVVASAQREASALVYRDWRIGLHSSITGKQILGNVTFTETDKLATGGTLKDGYFESSPGSTLSFTRNSSCSYNVVGGYYDTPTCGVARTGYDASGGTYTANINKTIGTRSLVSENPSVVTCSSNTSCSVVGYGETTITAMTPVSFYGSGSAYGALGSSGNRTATFSPNGSGSASISWRIKVPAPNTPPPDPVLSASCYGAPNNVSTTPANITWTATSTGGTGSYTYSWSGTDSLTGTGSTLVKNYTATGTKQANVLVTSGTATTSVNCYGTISNGGGSCSINCGVCVNCGTCTPGTQTKTEACPSGQIGSISLASTSTCPGPLWGSWYETANTCTNNNDECSNIPGDQYTVPFGASQDDNNNCYYRESSLDCTSSITFYPRTPVNVNNMITLTNDAPFCSDCTKTWTSDDNTTITNTASGAEVFFTTVGLKKVTFTQKRTPTSGNPVFGTCSGEVDIVLTGGNIHEN